MTGNEFKQARLDLEITTRQLSIALGLSEKTVYNIEQSDTVKTHYEYAFVWYLYSEFGVLIDRYGKPLINGLHYTSFDPTVSVQYEEPSKHLQMRRHREFGFEE